MDNSFFSSLDGFKQNTPIELHLNCATYIPQEKESAVVSDKPKTAAIFYDRVWGEVAETRYDFNKMPTEIGFCGETIMEILKLHQNQLFNPKNKASVPMLKNILRNRVNNLPNFDKPTKVSEIITRLMLRDVACEFSLRYNKKVSTLFSDSKLQSLSFREGSKDVIISTIENLQIIDEKALTWQQVLELRNDKVSRSKYKRFIHWLDKEMVGKSQSFVEDDIAIKLEDYEQTLKKHGIKTILGTVKEIINSKTFLAGVGLESLGFSLDSPLPVLIGGGAVVVAGIAVNLAEKKLAYEECETGANSEISWVYEVKKKAQKGKL